MSQPVAGFQYTVIGTVGTVLVTERPTVLANVVLGGTFVGTVSFYDTGTITGTSLSNNIFTIGNPLLNQYKTVDVNLRCKNGLVYASTGTPAITIGWD